MSWENIFRLYEKVIEEASERDLGEPLADFLSRHHPREIPDELDELTVQALLAMAQYDAGVVFGGVSGMGMRFAARSTILVTSLLHSAYLVGKQGKSQECSEEPSGSSEEPSWEQAFEDLSQLHKFQAEFKEEFPDVDPEMGESICRLRLFLESNYNKQVCTEHRRTVAKASDAIFDYLVQGLSHSDPSDLAEDTWLQVTWHLAGAIFSSGYTKGRAEK